MKKHIIDFSAAAALLLRGGLLIYPTETYYALGCMANNNAALNAIYKIKNRSLDKPMPVIAADYAQAQLCADISRAPQSLLKTFWPGPLTVVLPARPALAPILRNRQNKIAIRISSCNIAAALAKKCGFCLAASSANLSGAKPAKKASDIDAELLHALRRNAPDFGILAADNPENALGAASTIVEPFLDGKRQLRLLRAGAVSKSLLEQKNFEIID